MINVKLMYSCEIRKATALCAFFEISMRHLKTRNNTGKWL